MSVRSIGRRLDKNVISAEDFTTNWDKWTQISGTNTGSYTATAGVGKLVPPGTGYRTNRMTFDRQGDMPLWPNSELYVEFMFDKAEEQYLDIAVQASNTLFGKEYPVGGFVNFYPAGDNTFSFVDSDGQYLNNEQKRPFTYAAGVWYAIRIKRRGKLTSMKAWNTANAEPKGFQFFNSATPATSGADYVSLGITSGYNTQGAVSFRNMAWTRYLDEPGYDISSAPDLIPTASTVTSSGHLWTMSFSTDFPTNVAEGGFRNAYPNIASYNEEQGDTDSARTGGKYSTNKTVSVVNNILTVNQRVISGTPYGAMILPDNYAPHLYGRAVFRSRQTDVAGKGGFKFVPLWWPSSDNWDDGEIDWPEADNGQFPRPASATTPPQTKADGVSRKFFPEASVYADGDTSGWHVYAVDWAPDAISFYQDGKLVARMVESASIPTKNMRFGFQMETWIGEGVPDAAAAGRIEVDWVAIYNLTA